MKTRNWLTLFLCLYILPCAGWAQCGTTHVLSYDTAVNGTGGTDNPYNLTFPKFDASTGTLLDVKVISVLSITYQYDIENKSSSAQTLKLRVNREDEITSSVLNDPIYNDYSTPSAPGWISHALAASDGVTGSGPDFKSVAPFSLVNNDTVINQSADNPANFLGSGQISFDYASSMSLTSTPISSVQVTNPIATDNIKFVLQYIYCDNVMLASEIVSFTAAKSGTAVSLHWQTANELNNHQYEVQKSTDGIHFVTVGTLPAHPSVNQSGSYDFLYTPQTGDTGKLYFRIRQAEFSGTDKYSVTRTIDPASVPGNGIKLVPNPSNGRFSIMIDNAAPSDWTIELFNIKGQVICQRQVMHASLNPYLMNESLPSGVYFVMVTNKKTNQKLVERMIVR